MDEDFYYMAHVMRLAALLHSIVSLAMLIAYYHLKVPLAIFKREKEIARRLEFEGLYIAEQPEDDDLKSHWDKLVISAKYEHSLFCLIIFNFQVSICKFQVSMCNFQSIQQLFPDLSLLTIGINLLRKKFDRSIVKRTISILSVIY